MRDFPIIGQSEPSQLIKIPLIAEHDQRQLIGTVVIEKRFMPDSPDFHFELGLNVLERDSSGVPTRVDLVEISLCMNLQYHQADAPSSPKGKDIDPDGIDQGGLS